MVDDLSTGLTPNAIELIKTRVLDVLPREETIAIPLLLSCTTMLDLGATTGSYLAAKGARKAFEAFRERQGITPINDLDMVQLVHRAKWSAAQLIVRELKETCSEPDVRDDYRQLLAVIGQALSDPPTTLQVETTSSAPSSLWGRIKARFAGDPADQIDAQPGDLTVVSGLSHFLERPSEREKSEADQRHKSILLDRLGKEALELFIDEFRRTPATANFNEADDGAGQSFFQALRDPDRGWVGQFRLCMKAALEDPQNEGIFKRQLLDYTAGCWNASVRIESMIEGLTHRLEILQGRLDQALLVVNGQNDRLEGVDAALGQLLDILRPALPLERFGTDAVIDPQDRDAYFLDFVFTRQKTTFVGRDLEFDRLKAFLLDPDRNVSWWQIAGDAGQGKSRLALELIDHCRSRNWNAGFLRMSDLQNFARQSANIRIAAPTLIVIDYVAAPDKTADCLHLLDGLRRRAALGQKPVRVLFVERAPYRALSEQAGQAGTSEALWYRGLRGQTQLNSLCFEPASALVLDSLGDDVMTAIANSWLSEHGEDILTETERETFLTLIDAPTGGPISRSDRARRPLFAMLFASLIKGDSNLEDLTLQGALRLALLTEQRQFWGADIFSDAALRLTCLTNILGQVSSPQILSLDSTRYGWGDAGGIRETEGQTWTLLGRRVTASATGPRPSFTAREPDLFGEFFLLWAAEEMTGCRGSDLDKARIDQVLGPVLDDAWTLDADRTLEFLTRLSEDFRDLNAELLFRALAARPLPEGASRPRIGRVLGQDRESPFEVILFGGWTGLEAILDFGIEEVRLGLGEVVQQGKLITQVMCEAVRYASGNGHGCALKTLIDAVSEDGRSEAVRHFNPESRTFPLLLAAQNGHADVVNHLLATLSETERGEAVQQCHDNGGFPLLMAAQDGHAEVVERLLAAIPEPERSEAVRQVNARYGTFPLLMAAQYGHAEVVGRLLAELPEDERSEAVRQCHEDGGFPLLQAAQQGHADVVERLLAALPENERGKAVRQINAKKGTFPLLLAAENGRTKIVEHLLEALPFINRVYAVQEVNARNGAFPLLQAAQQGHADVVERLLAAIPEPERSEAVRQVNAHYGTFPLMMAARNGHAEAVKILIKAGASLDQRSERWGTALDVTLVMGHWSVAAALQAQGARCHHVRPIRDETGHLVSVDQTPTSREFAMCPTLRYREADLEVFRALLANDLDDESRA